MTDPFKALLFVLCGVCLNAGLSSLLIGLRLRREPVFAFFGAMATSMALFAASVTLSYLTTNDSAMVVLIHIATLFMALSHLTLVWFVAVLSGYTPRRFLLSITGLVAFIIVITLLHPYGTFLSEFTGVAQKTASWGELFMYPSGTISLAQLPLSLNAIASYVFMFYCGREADRNGRRGIAVSIWCGAGVFSIAMVLDSLVSFGLMNSYIIISTAGMLLFVMLMSYHIAERLFRRGEELETVNAAMRRESAARKNSLDRQERLSEELNHRVRNNLASVLSLINITRHNAESVGTFADTLRARVRAMSEAHELLAQGNWEEVKLRPMLETILSQFVPWDPKRLRLTGPDITIRPGQTVPIAMSLHELAVNALGHGSLGKPEGILEVRWEEVTEMDEVNLVWREIGTADKPVEKKDGGRGLTLVRGFIEHELGGRMDWTMEPHGARCELSWPLTMKRVSLIDQEGQSLEESAGFSFRLFKKL